MRKEYDWAKAAERMKTQPDFHKLHYEKLKEINQMAPKKKSKNAKTVKVAETKKSKKRGRPKSEASESSAKGEDTKPVVLHLPRKLAGRAKLVAIGLGTNLSSVLRDFLKGWTKENEKALISALKKSSDDEDEEEVEEEEVEEEEGEEEEEESEDEDEEESDDEDEDEEEEEEEDDDE